MSKKKQNNEENAESNVTDTVEKDLKTDIDYEKILSEKDSLLADNEEKYKRLLAEYDNYKKRTVREKEAIYTDSVRDTVEVLLPVIDNLIRALDSFEDKDSEHYKGVEMVLRQTQEAFQKLGIEKIKSVGEQFNPEVHNAVMHVEDDSVGANTVVEEFQKGYTYKDKVIRYSMVKVAN